jgi:hypothetical protein
MTKLRKKEPDISSEEILSETGLPTEPGLPPETDRFQHENESELPDEFEGIDPKRNLDKR